MFPAILVMLWAYLEFTRGYPTTLSLQQEQRKSARYGENIYSRIPAAAAAAAEQQQTILLNAGGGVGSILNDIDFIRAAGGSRKSVDNENYRTDDNGKSRQQLRQQGERTTTIDSENFYGGKSVLMAGGRPMSYSYNFPLLPSAAGTSSSAVPVVGVKNSAAEIIIDDKSEPSSFDRRNETFQIIKIVRVSSSSIGKPKPVILRPIPSTTTVNNNNNILNNIYNNLNDINSNKVNNRYGTTLSMLTDLIGRVRTDNQYGSGLDFKTTGIKPPDERINGERQTTGSDLKKFEITTTTADFSSSRRRNFSILTSAPETSRRNDIIVNLTPAFLTNLVPIKIVEKPDATSSATITYRTSPTTAATVVVEPTVQYSYRNTEPRRQVEYPVAAEFTAGKLIIEDDLDKDPIRLTTEPSWWYNNKRDGGTTKSDVYNRERNTDERTMRQATEIYTDPLLQRQTVRENGKTDDYVANEFVYYNPAINNNNNNKRYYDRPDKDDRYISKQDESIIDESTESRTIVVGIERKKIGNQPEKFRADSEEEEVGSHDGRSKEEIRSRMDEVRRPEEFHSVPELVHSEPEQIHNLPEQIHGLPEQVHGLPEQIHGLPEQIHGLPEQVHGLPEQVHGLPEQVHGLPEQVHGLPEQIHGLPEEIHGQPERVHSQPEQIYGEPAAIIHGEPERVHGMPEEVHAAVPERIHGVPAAESFYTTSDEIYVPTTTERNRYYYDSRKKNKFLGREPAPVEFTSDEIDHTVIDGSQPPAGDDVQTATFTNNEEDDVTTGIAYNRQTLTTTEFFTTTTTTAETPIDNSGPSALPRIDHQQKSSYVVDHGNYRKYRVEERTPDGFIVGEYGVVSRHDGSLRGVRYTADSNINPSIIYETLVKFFTLKK